MCVIEIRTYFMSTYFSFCFSNTVYLAIKIVVLFLTNSLPVFQFEYTYPHLPNYHQHYLVANFVHCETKQIEIKIALSFTLNWIAVPLARGKYWNREKIHQDIAVDIWGLMSGPKLSLQSHFEKPKWLTQPYPISRPEAGEAIDSWRDKIANLDNGRVEGMTHKRITKSYFQWRVLRAESSLRNRRWKSLAQPIPIGGITMLKGALTDLERGLQKFYLLVK